MAKKGFVVPGEVPAGAADAAPPVGSRKAKRFPSPHDGHQKVGVAAGETAFAPGAPRPAAKAKLAKGRTVKGGKS